MAKGKEYEAQIKIGGGLDPSLQKAVDNAKGAISSLGGGLGKVAGVAGGAFKAIGTAAVTSLAAVGTAAVAGTKALMDLALEFDAASDAIRIGTGATGDALDSLMQDFDAVYSTVPTDMESASQAIADFNTCLGLTGEPLQQLSAQAIQVSNMLGDDLGGVIEGSSKAFQQWGISAEDMGEKMDYVFKASQSTGMGFTDLMNTVQSFGPQLQEMGFTFEEATALVGQLDKAGVNTSEVMGALKKSVTTMAKDGLSASEGLAQYTEAIKNAGSAAEATAIASEVFGARAGSTMATAIREGTLSVEELTAALEASDETIMKAAEDTMSFPEKLQLIKQQAQVAFEPLANELLNIAEDAMPLIADAAGQVIPLISGAMGKVIPVVKDLAAKVLPKIGEAMEKLSPFIETMLDTLAVALPPLLDVIMQVADNIGAIIGPAIEALMPYVIDLVNFIVANLPTIIDWISQIIGQVIELVAPIGEALMPILQSLFEAIMPVLNQLMTSIMPPLMGLIEALVPPIVQILNALQPLIDLILKSLPPIIDFIGAVLAGLTPLVQFIAEHVATVVTGTIEGIINAVEQVKVILDNVIDFVKNVFTGNWKGAWDNVKNIFGAAFNALAGLLKVPLNAVVALINKALEAINSISVEIPDWVPVYGGTTFGVNIPLIPEFARGGFTEGVSIAGEAGTEAVISFDPAYRQENLSYWARAGKLLGANPTAVDTVASNAKTSGGGGNTITFSPNVTIQGNADYDTVMQALRDNEEEFMDVLEEFLSRKAAMAYG